MTYEEKISELSDLLDAVNERIQQSYRHVPRGRSWNSTRSSDNKWLHRQLEERARLENEIISAYYAHGEMVDPVQPQSPEGF
jgi:hypothetical protein